MDDRSDNGAKVQICWFKKPNFSDLKLIYKKMLIEYDYSTSLSKSR